MTNDERRLHRKHLVTAAVAVVTSIVLLGLLYTVGTHRCLDKTLGFGREAMVFLQAACEKYDRYEQEENRGDAQFGCRGRVVFDVLAA